jgi:hypothetical protein
MAKTPKRPRDPNQLAKFIADLATGEETEAPPAATSPMGEIGRIGGLKGGNARAAALTPEQRSEIAKKAAAKRWAKKP